MPADPKPGNGEFFLYPNIAPMLLAGNYTLTGEQTLEANGRAAAQLPVDGLDVFIEVRSPRLVLPPDQVLSTFPPAESEGAYGARLPQVVIKRRTLPWERRVAGAPANAPWLALVVVAEGEAKLVPNVPARDTLTPGVTLSGDVDADVGNCLEIRQSMVSTLFPTRKDVPLLAHARHVDINDTELMMGDDDGFLAVVVANRLPVSARDESGEVPVKYTACLVNLEGQWSRLLPTAPPSLKVTEYLVADVKAPMSLARHDKHIMGGLSAAQFAGDPLTAAPAANKRVIAEPKGDIATAAQSVTKTGFSAGASVNATGKVGVLSGVVSETVKTDRAFAIDPILRFPVLLHWRFTSVGDATFESLMKNLDSQLLGSKPLHAPASDAGRPPLELVETGHVGLMQRTRRGDSIRAWYRGPFVPHPTDASIADRLPLAHAADQLRIVIPDGREDLSLASAFEIGRLLALANPNMVAALVRWRQLHFATVRRGVIWHENAVFLGALSGFALSARVGVGAAIELSRTMIRAVASEPDIFLGQPRALVDAGRPLPFKGSPATLMARAFGIADLKGEPDLVLRTLQKTTVRVGPLATVTRSTPTVELSKLDAATLTRTLTTRLETLVTDAVKLRPTAPAARRARRRNTNTPDALDEMIARLTKSAKRKPSE